MNTVAPIDGRCNARTKHGPCKKYPMKGKNRCRKHGGATPSGIASVHFKTGERSIALPKLPPQWAQFYNTEDPELVSLRQELALCRAATRSLLETTTDAMAKKGDKEANLIALFAQLKPMIELYEKLVSTESRRLKDREELVQRAEFARFVKAVLLVVATYIVDRETRGKIQTDVMRLLSVAAPPVLNGGTT